MLFKPRWLSVESYGLALVLISAIFYALAGAYVKLAHIQGDLPSTELVFARGVFQGGLVLLGLYVCRDAKGQRLIRHPFGQGTASQQLVWARGLIGGAGFLLDYHCMSVLPLGDAITLMSLYPITTIILARIFLQEEIRPFHVAVTVASVVGAIFIAQPTFIFGVGYGGDIPTSGYITGLLGSLCLASILILIRKAGTIGVHTFQLLLSWALFGIIFSLIFGRYEGTWKMPIDSTIWWYTFGVCSVGAGAHFMLNYAGWLAPAGLVSVVRASDIVWAVSRTIHINHNNNNNNNNNSNNHKKLQ
jgi:drug/metabolite transporter (DMT)-like permease